MILMFQREVADRIVAEPGSKSYGRLSVLTQWRTSPRKLFTLPARAFTPPPKVDSALVEFTPRNAPEDAGSAACLAQVTAVGIRAAPQDAQIEFENNCAGPAAGSRGIRDRTDAAG